MSGLLRRNLNCRLELDPGGHLVLIPNNFTDRSIRIAPGFWTSMTARMLNDTVPPKKVVITSLTGERICVLIAKGDHVAAWYIDTEKDPLIHSLCQMDCVRNDTHMDLMRRSVDAPEITLLEVQTLMTSQRSI